MIHTKEIKIPLCENLSSVRDDKPVNPVPAYQPNFTKIDLNMAEKTSPFLGKVFNIAGKECMGKIDVCDKMYFSDRRRFADFINVHIYQKRKTVFPKDLLLMKGKYPSMSSASGEKERAILVTLRLDAVIAKKETFVVKYVMMKVRGSLYRF